MFEGNRLLQWTVYVRICSCLTVFLNFAWRCAQVGIAIFVCSLSLCCTYCLHCVQNHVSTTMYRLYLSIFVYVTSTACTHNFAPCILLGPLLASLGCGTLFLILLLLLTCILFKYYMKAHSIQINSILCGDHHFVAVSIFC